MDKRTTWKRPIFYLCQRARESIAVLSFNLCESLSQIQMTSTPYTNTHTHSSCAFDYCLLVSLSVCVCLRFFSIYKCCISIFSFSFELKFSDVFFAKHLHTPLALVSCTYACVVTDCWRHQQCPSSWRNHKLASKYGCKWWASERKRVSEREKETQRERVACERLRSET